MHLKILKKILLLKKTIKVFVDLYKWLYICVIFILCFDRVNVKLKIKCVMEIGQLRSTWNEELMGKHGIDRIFISSGGSMEEVLQNALSDGDYLSAGRPWSYQLSMDAARIDRGRTMLEFEGRVRCMFHADVLVFRDEASRERYETGAVAVYYGNGRGYVVKETKELSVRGLTE